MLLTWALPPCQAEEALKSGLVDVVVGKPEDLLATAKALALDIANGVKPKVQALRKTDKLPNMMARLSCDGGECDGNVLTQDTHHPGAELHPGHRARGDGEGVCCCPRVFVRAWVASLIALCALHRHPRS